MTASAKTDAPSRSLEKPQEGLAPSQLSHAVWKYPSHFKYTSKGAPMLISLQHCIPTKDGECMLSCVLSYALMPAKSWAVHCSDCHTQRHWHWTCDWQCGTGLLKAAGHQRWCLWGGMLQAGLCGTSTLTWQVHSLVRLCRWRPSGAEVHARGGGQGFQGHIQGQHRGICAP